MRKKTTTRQDTSQQQTMGWVGGWDTKIRTVAEGQPESNCELLSAQKKMGKQEFTQAQIQVLE